MLLLHLLLPLRALAWQRQQTRLPQLRALQARRLRLDQVLQPVLDALTGADGGYIRSALKIEAGAKSALDPHVAATVTPYVAQDLPDLDLAVTNVVTVQPSLFCLLLLWDGRVDVDRQCRMLRGIRRVYMPTAIIGAIFFFRFWTWFDVVRHF